MIIAALGWRAVLQALSELLKSNHLQVGKELGSFTGEGLQLVAGWIDKYLTFAEMFGAINILWLDSF